MEEDEEEKGRDVTAAGEVGRRVRVLVVDDSLVDRKIVERLLVRSGFDLEVIVVDSGKKAVEVLGLNEEKVEPSIAYEKKPDIVLTDYCMPEMNGYDLLKAIKESVCSKYIPVVIMSSENDPQRIRRCLDSGAEDFIMKPLQTADLQRLVNYARPSIASAPKVGTKRKLPLDSVTESTESERRPRLAGVAVA